MQAASAGSSSLSPSVADVAAVATVAGISTAIHLPNHAPRRRHGETQVVIGDKCRTTFDTMLIRRRRLSW